MRKNIHKKQYGFSLIETLIAVSILMIAIAGPLSLVQAGLFSSIHQRNQVTAIYLAQEALEYIKNLRDTNSYIQNRGDTRNWLAGPDPDNALLTDTCATGCYVDPHGTLPETGNAFVQDGAQVAGGESNLPLKLTSVGGVNLYSYDNLLGAVTSFIRTVKVVPVELSENEVTVSVRIDWTDNLMPRWYTVSENIYDIYSIDSTYNTVDIPPPSDVTPPTSQTYYCGGINPDNSLGLYNAGFCPGTITSPTTQVWGWTSSGVGASSCPTDATNVCKYYRAKGCGVIDDVTGPTSVPPPGGGKPCNNDSPTDRFWPWELVQTEVFGSGVESCDAGVVRPPVYSPNFYCTYYMP